MEAREGGDGGFSPRATVEDIQRRLLRPSPSLHSPPPTPFCRGKNAQGRNSSQFKANYTGLYRNREAKKGETLIKKRKLEDYLDPVLLSAVSSKISRMETIPKMTVKREVRDFEWPVDELRMLMQDTAVGKEKIDAVNLGNDSDNLLENDEDGDVLFSTPFQKFEQTALYESSLVKAFSIVSFALPIRKCSEEMPPPLTFLSISNQPPQSQPVMAQQDDGWPLGLRLLNARVGLLENRNFPGSISFNTLPTGSPISFTDSSDLDSESSGSFFHAKSITLGSLIGDSTSSIMELSRRGNTEANLGGDRKINNFRFKYKPWLFSLCCKLSTDVVSATRTHSLAHFLEVERRRTAATAAARPLPIAGRANNLLTS